MKNEAEFKSAFKKSVKAQGGFAISLAAPMLAGIPDLYVIMPGFMPVLLEAKWLGEVKEHFNRKIQATPLQQMYINECNGVKFNSALYLVGYKQDKSYKASLIVHSAGYASNHWISSSYVDKQFDVVYLFNNIGIPRFNGVHAK